jgi:hypothetical protein
VADANSATATANFSLTVNSAVAATQVIAAETLTYNTAAAFTPVTGAGGTGTLTYSITPTLPSGLSLNAGTGAVTGTPAVTGTATSYTVTVTDMNNGSAAANFTLAINQATQSALSVTGMPTTAQAYNTSFTVGSSGGSGTGTVTFIASAACSASGSTVTMISGTGTCSMYATKADDNDYSSATSATASVSAAQATPSVTAWPTASAINYGATLASSTLKNGTASVQGSFAWTTPTIAPAVGTSSYNVTFTPTDTTDYAVVTGTVSVTTLSIDFSSSFNGATTQTVIPGGSANYTFTLTPFRSTFPSAVTFSVSGLPPGATATFSPGTIAPGSVATNVTLAIQTANTTAQKKQGLNAGKSAPLALALLLLPLWSMRRAARKWFVFVILLGGMAVSSLLTGCGGSYFSQAPQSYSVTITATSGSVTHRGVVTLNVE